MNRIMKAVAMAAVVAVALVAVSAATAAPRQVRQTERLVKRAEDTVREISNTRAQLMNTLDVYNELMSGAGDSKKLFSDLRGAANRSDSRREEVRKKGEEMEKEAHKFFEEWTQSLVDITDETLQARAQERLNETRLGFSGTLEAGRRAGADFDVFMGGLRDQITYLGYDLNPGGIASLAEDAERLNVQAQSMFARIDEAVSLITSYANALKAQ